MEVKFSSVISDDGRPCLAIEFSRNPTPDYTKHWDTWRREGWPKGCCD